MLDYEGCPCRICGKEFTASDDIVVCPDCGTPYHRSCWKEAGACTNTELHETGGSWKVINKQKKKPEPDAPEEYDAADTGKDGGQPVFQANFADETIRLNPEDETIGLDPNEDYDGATMGELAEFVSSNKFYYLPLFKLMKKTGRKFSLNLICLFFPELYFANRKMWAGTLISVLIQVLFSIPSQAVFMTSQFGIRLPWVDTESVTFQEIYRISGGLHFLVSILLCLFANYLYYRWSVRKIGKLRAAAVSDAEFHHSLRAEGGTSTGNVILAVVIEAACLLAVTFLMIMI